MIKIQLPGVFRRQEWRALSDATAPPSLKLEPGETAIIRNVGGRVNPALLETIAILGTVSRAAGEAVDPDWNLVVLQHTDCGMNGCYHHPPKLLLKYMGVADDKLDDLANIDPYKAVPIDVAALKPTRICRARLL
ncbi:hypothetical protein [Caballeronia sordidicola]|uniref:Carbonic anhydrase n=1 Tax=Caballeronia sordidicola TaxID=196367 RepID=A0A242N8Q9_CABSO|nr:hypothetical protein [Caballeronia sordidicola]OTP79804.1 Carbonic anhydrase [Caballeronia sordidicola]